MNAITNHVLKRLVGPIILGLLGVSTALAFESESDGSDGALNLTMPGTVSFSDFPADADGDSIYHFTTINIAAGVTVDFRRVFTGPIHWLATGDVRIDGEIVLDGEKGNPPSVGFRGLPGAGGFRGGTGLFEPGRGPGRGDGTNPFCGGFPASHLTGSRPYGNAFSLPMIGGSGGAASPKSGGSGGGGGGGAILIASNTQIEINGKISVDGGGALLGDPTDLGSRGGGGSGGAIRLIADTISGSGVLSARGGSPDEIAGNTSCGNGFAGSAGRIRAEAFQLPRDLQILSPATFSTPGIVFLSPDQLPIRIVSVGGVPVPSNPSGNILVPDVTINNPGPTTIEIAGQNVPLNTSVTITVIPETGDQVTASSTPLVGTVEASTATAELTIPAGNAQIYLQANF